jgi:hypothetical protein
MPSHSLPLTSRDYPINGLFIEGMLSAIDWMTDSESRRGFAARPGAGDFDGGMISALARKWSIRSTCRRL